MKYPLLLKELLKNTPESNPVRPKISESLNSIEEAVSVINEEKRKSEGQQRLAHIVRNKKTKKKTAFHKKILSPFSHLLFHIYTFVYLSSNISFIPLQFLFF